jgi:bifunctional UDP-N-acetylglucosamine pyrophosphorylase/glucosamine-1-phosphate N-acetyltransferase
MSKPNKRAAIILAAGKSTRMKSKRSKVLHEVGGLTMLAWVAQLAKSAGAEKTVVVVNGGPSDVRAAAENLGLEIAVQEPQLGTGHAVLAAKDQFEGYTGDLIILYADTPLIQPDTLDGLFKTLENGNDVGVLGFQPEDPGAYGRLIIENCRLNAIVEAKDATDEELAVGTCNSGVMVASAEDMFSALNRVTNDNANSEYYLTDVIGILREEGKNAAAHLADPTEVLGVNSRKDLALAEQAFQNRMRSKMMDDGVTLRDPDTIYFSHDTEIGADAEIGAHVVFGPGVRVEVDAIIHSYCHFEGATIGKGAQIGPFARLRPGTQLGENSKVGNFVEVKKTIVGKGSKINHLSYIGDAEIGENSNIGAGTITCNYDGFSKYKTTIGDRVFVGTHSSLIAPVTIGSGAYLATGGVITKDVPEDALAVGRVRQENKIGWAKRLRDAKQKRKSK